MSDRDHTPDREFTVLAEHLERLLAAQFELYERMFECIVRKREAIRRADIEAITMICREEHALADRMTALERERLDLVGAMTRRLDPGAARPLDLTALAEHVEADQRGELLARATELREAVARVQRESSIVAAAAEALSRHIAGVMQKVTGALSSVRIYERRGRLASGSQLDCCVDLKS